MVERAPQNGFCQCLCPQGELQLPPTSPGDSLGVAGRFDLASGQITASALGSRGCEILYLSFQSEASISPSPLGLSEVSPTELQSQMFWGLIFLVQDPWAGSLTCGSDLSLLWENLCDHNYSPVCGLPSQGYGT